MPPPPASRRTTLPQRLMPAPGAMAPFTTGTRSGMASACGSSGRARAAAEASPRHACLTRRGRRALVVRLLSLTFALASSWTLAPFSRVSRQGPRPGAAPGRLRHLLMGGAPSPSPAPSVSRLTPRSPARAPGVPATDEVYATRATLCIQVPPGDSPELTTPMALCPSITAAARVAEVTWLAWLPLQPRDRPAQPRLPLRVLRLCY